MKRRTRITLAAAALTVAALGGTYGLVAQQGVPSVSSNTAAAATESAAPPPVTHTHTRAS
jgi:ABC-type glycerol-3-phosphate transport system substrate-binding protein